MATSAFTRNGCLLGISPGQIDANDTPASDMFWPTGISAGYGTNDTATLNKIVQLLGRRPDFFRSYHFDEVGTTTGTAGSAGSYGFPTPAEKALLDQGWYLMASFKASNLSWAQVAAGQHNTVLDNLAQNLIRWKADTGNQASIKKVILCFHHEPSNDPDPAADFVAAFRFVVNRFKNTHAIGPGLANDIVEWAYVDIATAFQLNGTNPYYPGDTFVTWAMADPYNWGGGLCSASNDGGHIPGPGDQAGSHYNDNWRDVKDTNNRIIGWSDTHPGVLIGIAETGVSEDVDRYTIGAGDILQLPKVHDGVRKLKGEWFAQVPRYLQGLASAGGVHADNAFTAEARGTRIKLWFYWNSEAAAGCPRWFNTKPKGTVGTEGDSYTYDQAKAAFNHAWFQGSAPVPPTAALAVSPSSGQASLVVTASAAGSAPGSNPISTYTFDWGDGTAQTGPQAGNSAGHTYTAAGTYTCTVTVTDTAGNSDTASRTVTVSPASQLTSVFTATPASGAAPLTVNVDASGSLAGGSPIATHQWSWGDGSADTGPQAGATSSHQYTVPGTYTITHTVRDTLGVAATSTKVVTVTPAQVLTAVLALNPSSGVAPLQVTADGSGSRNNGVNPIVGYAWSWGDGTTTPESALTSQQHTYQAPGTYTVTLTVRDSTSATHSTSRQVTVVPAATVDAQLSVSPTSGAAPLAVVADASASLAGANPIATYTFDWGDGSAATTGSSPTAGHSYSQAGTFTVRVTVTDTGGDFDTATVLVTVTTGAPPPEPPPAFSEVRVFGTLADAAGVNLERGKVIVELLAPSGVPVTVLPTRETIVAPYEYEVPEGTGGAFSFTAAPQSQCTPADSYYQISFAVPGRARTKPRIFVVPDDKPQQWIGDLFTSTPVVLPVGTKLDDLADVAVAGASSGQVLGLVGSSWQGVTQGQGPPGPQGPTGPAGPGATVQDEGTALAQRAAINFVGAGVTATDDLANNRTNVSIPGAAAGGYQTVQNEGTGLTQRSVLNFVGDGVTATDDSGSARTNVTIPAPPDISTANPQPAGTPAAGSTGDTADAGHVHGLAAPATPQALGTAAAGSGHLPARDSHVHPGVMPWRHASGRWYSPPGNVTTDQFGSNGSAVMAPLVVGQATTFDRIALEVTTAGSAGAVIRLGIYADNGNGLPGDRVLDAGTIDATTTGVKELTINQALNPGLYWLVAASQGAASTQPIVRACGNAGMGLVGGVNAPQSTALSGLSYTGYTGALPTPATTSGAGIQGAIARILVRAA